MNIEEYKKLNTAHSQSKRIHALFERQMKQAEIFFVSEYQFHKKRKWKFDFALAGCKAEIFENMNLKIFADFKRIAIEIEGGYFLKKGGHSGGVRQLQDNEKFNEAALLSWRIFKFSPQQVKSGEAINFIKRIFE